MATLSLMEKAGQSIPKGLIDNRIETIFNATGLNWNIIQQPVHSSFGPIKGVVANYRSDTQDFLGFVHPKKYQVVTNLQAFNFIDDLPNFTLEKVGMFNGGRNVFVIGKSTEQLCINDSDDMLDFYLTFLHGHDGKSGIKFIICPIRMFCMNQLNLMMKTARFKYNITHTGDIDWKLRQTQIAIANSHTYMNELSDTITNMINHKPAITINVLVNRLIPDSDDDTEHQVGTKNDMRNAIIDLYNNKDDLQNYKNTSFGMLSAVSDYISHANPKRNGSQHTINNMFIRNIEGNTLLETAKEMLMAA